MWETSVLQYVAHGLHLTLEPPIFGPAVVILSLYPCFNTEGVAEYCSGVNFLLKQKWTMKIVKKMIR